MRGVNYIAISWLWNCCQCESTDWGSEPDISHPKMGNFHRGPSMAHEEQGTIPSEKLDIAFRESRSPQYNDDNEASVNDRYCVPDTNTSGSDIDRLDVHDAILSAHQFDRQLVRLFIQVQPIDLAEPDLRVRRPSDSFYTKDTMDSEAMSSPKLLPDHDFRTRPAMDRHHDPQCLRMEANQSSYVVSQDTGQTPWEDYHQVTPFRRARSSVHVSRQTGHRIISTSQEQEWSCHRHTPSMRPQEMSPDFDPLALRRPFGLRTFGRSFYECVTIGSGYGAAAAQSHIARASSTILRAVAAVGKHIFYGKEFRMLLDSIVPHEQPPSYPAGRRRSRKGPRQVADRRNAVRASCAHPRHPLGSLG